MAQQMYATSKGWRKFSDEEGAKLVAAGKAQLIRAREQVKRSRDFVPLDAPEDYQTASQQAASPPAGGLYGTRDMTAEPPQRRRGRKPKSELGKDETIEDGDSLPPGDDGEGGNGLPASEK